MKIILKIALKREIKQVQDFFEKYLSENNAGITNREFLCPFGIEGAINRKQIMILKDSCEIVGALRFYPRKRDNITSVYQFALQKDFRGKGLIRIMLQKTGYKTFESNCFLDYGFNKYYEKTGWNLEKKDKKFNYWRIKI